MIPGSNLLAMALRVISSQEVQHFRFLTRSTNAIGQDVANYADPAPIGGSFQPVPRAAYINLGLDFNRDYAVYYTSNAILDIGRDESGDQFEYGGRRWQALSDNDWKKVDGWVGVMMIDIGTATGSCQC